MKIVDDNGVVSEELKTIIEHTNDLMFVKNKDFVYIESSKAFAVDCVRCNGIEDVIGKTDFELFEDQAVAQKYRDDDLSLFTSNKPMIEFEEVYPDKNGKKHVCMTTKYLLFDKDGNPAGIFGQYHDIGEQVEFEIAHRRDINKNVVAALSNSFFAANYADLITHKYVTVRAMDYAKKMVDNCETIEQAFDAFINTLVKPEFQEKMREFCKSDTIAERVKGKSQIDCEYLSNVAKGWCRASFFPVEWNENGEVTHVLFAVSGVDERKAQENDENIFNKNSMEAIFDEVPGGIVLYEWNGKELKVLRMSKYYQNLYGYSMLNNSDSPNYMSIHPDDVEEYQKAIIDGLTKTHHLEYVFRVWNQKRNRYGWTKINAIAKPQSNGTTLVYAMYSDVTEQKDAELEKAKKQASLEAALSVSNQVCCEYDPKLHTVKCLTENNFFNLKALMENYPECIREHNIVHPEDVELFIKTVHLTDDGKTDAHCDVRAKRDGEYHWYSCRLQPYYDTEKERMIIILTIIDATLRIASIQDFEDRVRSMLAAKENTLSICSINVTQNTFKMVGMKGDIKKFVDEEAAFEEVMLGVTDKIIGEQSKEKYRELFSRDNLLKQASLGNMHVKMEYLLELSEDHYEWITAVVDMVNNPVSGEIGGIAYSKSSQKSYMEKALLASALKQDYIFSVIVFKDTDEFYIYNSTSDSFSDRMQNFWDVALSSTNLECSQETLENMKQYYNKEKMFQYLDENQEFTYAFDSMYTGSQSRLEAKFRYLDDEHNMLLVTVRNITDSMLMDKWRYESTHDLITGLYNRKTVFEQCRKLLNEHPDEQFVIMHGDIKHFHLYNTFFGEEAGNNILRMAADSLREMDKDYDFWTFGRIEADVFCTFFPLRQKVLEKHVKEFLEKISSIRSDFLIDISLGVYMVTDASMSIEAMFTRASIAAKSDKKNMLGVISVYDEAMEQSLTDSQQVISEMQNAINQEEFKVYLQPKYSLRTEKMVGAEALVRWIHHEKGMISPGKFIPVFEGNGFITTLDRYMWEHVCQILRKWQDEGKTLYPISVNVSRISMYIQSTVPYLKDLVTRYGIDPKYLELELTESAYMDDKEDLKRMLKELQEFGFTILMDDFGSGYSSLNTLRELPVNILKLDMKFLSNSQNDYRGLAVLSSVVRMSKLLNLPIVAEGVEKREQADYLCSIGCEYVQGFLFARPMPVEEYENLLSLENNDSIENSDKKSKVISATELDAIIAEDSTVSLGVLEYADEHFAYLRTNKKFLKEFGLIENLNPASKVFREHLDDSNYNILIQAFEYVSEEKKDAIFSINWIKDDGTLQNYCGHLHYNGNIGNYADLTAIFVNATNVKTFGLNGV